MLCVSLTNTDDKNLVINWILSKWCPLIIAVLFWTAGSSIICKSSVHFIICQTPDPSFTSLPHQKTGGLFFFIDHSVRLSVKAQWSELQMQSSTGRISWLLHYEALAMA